MKWGDEVRKMYQPGTMDFKTTRTARDFAGDDKRWQRRLALEDRRSFARESVAAAPWEALGLAALAPAEMGMKFAYEHTKGTPLAFDGERYMGRSGYFDPWANVGATWTGIGQGLSDFITGMFSSKSPSLGFDDWEG